MDLGFSGKVAIVTGGGMGIGAAIAVELAREGCDVAVVDRDTEAAASVVTTIEGLGRKGLALESDVSSHADAKRVVAEVQDKLGSFEILVCNAGITLDGVVWKMSEEQWDQVISVNLKGYFNYNKAAATVFMGQKYGKIVNVASINGLRGKFGQANYTASKGGAIALSKTLARELGKFNVNVNVIAPGMVLTDMMDKVPAEFKNKALEETVVGRYATPEDVAELTAFLVSDRSRHITGEVIKIDGGQYI